ncbi:hypothetical protein GCM10027168_19760 [Streptomyces capparidis]
MRTPARIWDGADLVERRLAGVALNPAAAEDVLLRLLAAGPLPVRMVLCRDRVLPDAVVDAVVAHPDALTRSFFARNPHADPALRARLVDDPDWLVRAHLSAPPNRPGGAWPLPLPDRVLERMLCTYGDELDPFWFRQASMAFRRSMPTHPRAAVRRAAVTFWPVLPDDARAALRADPDEAVRESARDRLRYGDPGWVERSLAEATGARGRNWLLSVGALGDAVVAAVAAEPDGWEARWAMAGNETLPAHAVRLLAADPDARVREAVARHPRLGPAERAALAADPHPDVRLAVSTHPALSEEERAAIEYEVPMDGTFGYQPEPLVPTDPVTVREAACSAHPLLRRWAARDHHLPPDLVRRLAADDDLGVRVLLAQNHPHAPAELLLRGFLEYRGDERDHLLTRPHFPTEGLAEYADHDDPLVRALAARDPATGPAVVERLTRDPDPRVRAAFARHPNLPPPRLRELLHDEALAHDAAANPALGADGARRLVESHADRLGE